MKFEVTILGCSAAAPAVDRHPTAQVVNLNEHFLLLDCGEGTQIQMRKYRIKIQAINHIFISHLHGDHFFGLMGLLSTFHLLGRKKELHVYSPAGLQEIVEVQFKWSGTQLTYPVHFHELAGDKPGIICDQKSYTVSAFPMQHRIPCYGFLVQEKTRPRTILSEKIIEHMIPLHQIAAIKAGADFETTSGIIANCELTEDPPKARTYAYCSDTAYSEDILSAIQGADLLYHEATFAEAHKDRAAKTKHSTARQAATIAAKANVGGLIIGHFSARYRKLDELLTEAQEVFESTQLAEEGTVYPID